MLLIEDREHTVVAVDPTWWDRLSAHFHSDCLDKELADGQPPEHDRALALRGQALTSTRSRRTLAAGLARALADAEAPTIDSLMRIPLNRAAVLDAADALTELRSRLLAPGPVAAAGVARTRVLLTDGTGPLRGHRRPGLRTAVRRAIDELDLLDTTF